MKSPLGMMMKLGAAALLSTGLSACIVVPAGHARGPVYETPYPAGQVVVEAPPPSPYQEVIPVLPFPGAVWIGGYWGWSGGRHHWVPGYYERPRAGYRYEPHRWEPHGGRWHLRVGGWVRL
jgi:hypothetical protein